MTKILLASLARDVDRFLKFKRALGHSYREAEHMLSSFQRFAEGCAKATQRSGGGKRISLEATIQAWLSRPGVRKPITAGLELGLLRHLCLYRRRRDGRGFVPERAWAPQTESRFSPHVLSHAEVRQLLDAASRLQGRNMCAGMRTLLLTLYCTGLRFGEAVRLRMGDVDLEKRMLFIRDSKGKSRLVPFGTDLARELRIYLRDRASIAQASDKMATDAWFVLTNGRPLTVGTASEVVRRLLRSEGLKPKTGRVGPRPYDMRHTYAVHRLTHWNRKGLDVHARLPWLSAYMGHENVLGTEVYLHATPELLRLASQRFEKRFHQAGRKR
jgi:integrase/recombinase XerD